MVTAALCLTIPSTCFCDEFGQIKLTTEELETIIYPEVKDELFETFFRDLLHEHNFDGKCMDRIEIDTNICFFLI